MATEFEQLSDDMLASREAFTALAQRLAADDLNPAMVVEGGMIAVVELGQRQRGNGAMVDWLRDCADHIEAFALESLADGRA